ncbi:MAG: histidine kinase N-terminal 7TM domain-containing protein, partial [Bacteroidota bacterium]|nr:histidine kinase N-terminal 7TM domain-containing protein [Bacteroidota bacterium]
MCILTLVSFFPFLVYLALGIYTFSKNPNSILNRRFFISCMGFAVWALGFTLFYMAKNEDAASFWIKFARIGFLIQPAALLLFFMALIKEKRRWLQNLLYIPSLFFILEYLSSNVVISNPGVRQ